MSVYFTSSRGRRRRLFRGHHLACYRVAKWYRSRLKIGRITIENDRGEAAEVAA